MTLEELEATLPSGLHDASLRSLSVDYVEKTMVLDFEIDTSDLARELTRRGKITLKGLYFCVIDPPDVRCPFDDEGPLWLDAMPLSDLTPQPERLPLPLPEGVFGHCLYIHDWNMYLYLAARDARLEWTGEDVPKHADSVL